MSARVRVMPVPPALRLIRKTGTSPAWKRRDRRLAILGLAGQLDERDLLGGQRLLDQLQHLDELREHDDAAARSRPCWPACPSAARTWRWCTPPPAAGLEQARIAADLAQLEQRLQDGDVAAGEAALLDLVADALVHRQAHALVEVALALAELDLAAPPPAWAAARRRPAPWCGAAGTAARGWPAAAAGPVSPSFSIWLRNTRRKVSRSPRKPGIRK